MAADALKKTRSGREVREAGGEDGSGNAPDSPPEFVRFVRGVLGPKWPRIRPGDVARRPDAALLARLSPGTWEAIDEAAYTNASRLGRRVPAIEA